MNSPSQTLMEQIVDEVERLPNTLYQEVLDFIRHLRLKQEHHPADDTEAAFLATFDSWEDEREVEEIVADIYAQRTTSELELEM